MTQYTEAGNSNRMEKYAFEKLLGEWKFPKLQQITMPKSKSGAWEKIAKILVTSLIYSMPVETWLKQVRKTHVLL